MQYKYGFTEGMNKDISPNKRSPNLYYDAKNIRVVGNDSNTSGSIISEPGNIPLIKIPSQLKKVYSITIDITASGDSITIAPFNGTNRVVDISSCTSIDSVYNTIISNTGVAYDISIGRYKVVYKYNKIVVVGISNLYSVSSTSNGQAAVSLRMDEITEDLSIVGLGTVRDYLIIFTTGGTNAGDGQIWVCKYDSLTDTIEDADIIADIPYLNVDNHLLYNGKLDFSNYTVGEVISKYQDSNNLKIYFIDGNTTLKHINILDSNAMALDVNNLELIPQAFLNEPKITAVIKGGLYKAGMVQYAYQLYNLNGGESNFSPTSGLVHLTSYNEYHTTSAGYRGNNIEDFTGKSVKLSILGTDLSFEYIRVISIYYTTKEGQPIINVIHEGKNSGKIELIDSGDTILGVYTPTEFNAYGNTLIKPKTITTKNNYLIAANITEEYFDFDELYDWDSRTYRLSSGKKFKVDGTVYDYTVYSSIEETADCIEEDSDYSVYKYNESGDFGGSGTNIKYEFILQSIPIDNGFNPNGLGVYKISNQLWSSKYGDKFVDNNSYSNYTSPLNHMQLMGYSRGETYRFGIVIIDSLGRQSFVKYIEDIKFPEQHEVEPSKTTYYEDTTVPDTPKSDYKTFFNCAGGGGVQANILGIKFTVENLPAGYSYRIVRVKREEKDKSIIAQGVVGFTAEIDGNGILYPRPYISRYLPEGSPTPTNTKNDDSVTSLIASGYPYALTFKSPEVAFNIVDRLQEGDIIKFVNSIDVSSSAKIVTKITYKINEWYDRVIIQKIINGTTTFTPLECTVQDSIKVFPNATLEISDSPTYNFNNGGALTIYKNQMQGTFSGKKDASAYRGNALLVGTYESLTSLLNGRTGVQIANIVRDVSDIRYGGSTYYDKLNNYYINAGHQMLSTETTSYVFGGDIFITYFDYVNQMFQSNLGGNGGTSHDDPGIDTDERGYWERTNILYVPLESTICTELKYGSSYSIDANTYQINETVEEGNALYPDGFPDGAYNSSFKDLYLYNDVYSVEPTVKTYTPKPLYFTNSITNDCKFIVSQKHIDGQIIDSWTKFLPDNTTVVNGTFGSVNKILVYNNLLVFFQDKSCGVMSFNDRQLLNNGDTGQLVLGTGDMFDTYRYVSETYGTKNKFSVVDTEDSIYFFDGTSKKILRLNGNNVEPLSDIAGLSGYLKDINYDTSYDKPLTTIGTIGIYDSSVNRILFTSMSQDHTKDFTVGFNRRLNAFESFYSFIPSIYQVVNGKMLSCNKDDMTCVYLHTHNNISKARCEYYGTLYNPEVSIIASQQPDVKKVFTNIEFNCNLTDNYSNALEDYDNEVPDVSKHVYGSDIKLWNTWQNTDDINLSSTNIKRRFRTWRYQTPKVNNSRLMDYWLGIKFTYNSLSTLPEEIGNPKIFKLEDITVNHLIPIL